MSLPLFSADHSWALIDGEHAVIGVSHFAQQSLGPLVHVDLPDIGARIEQRMPCGMLESSKTASDVIAPLSGLIVAVNDAVLDDPELVNRAPLRDGWLLRVLPDAAASPALMTADDYDALLARG